MNYKISTMAIVAAATALGCSSETIHDVAVDATNSAPSVDATPRSVDATQQAARIPDWSLEDIQPMSPMFGQTYGLNAFPEKILVAVLVEGF